MEKKVRKRFVPRTDRTTSLAAPNSLKSLGNQRSNVLEGMRFLAALLVIISHAFTLSTGSSERE